MTTPSKARLENSPGTEKREGNEKGILFTLFEEETNYQYYDERNER